MHPDDDQDTTTGSSLALGLLRLLLPRAERDELLADLRAELSSRARANSPDAARRWLWWQLLRSAPALLRWGWWRERTGFEPQANTYRPGGLMLQTWISDARFAARRLRKRPTYAFIAVLTLALGIGGTTAVFAIGRPLIVDPLPYANADDVVTFWMPG
jgi:putative ABC transport system permease protein